jgi:hypothetical protein
VIDLTDKIHIERLFAAIDSARTAMRPFRHNRNKMIREYVGKHHNANGSHYEVLVNLLNMTADVYTIGLAANNPKVDISTQDQSLWPFAHRFKVGINNKIKEMRFAETLQHIVLDSLFGIGVSKTHLAESDPIQLEDDVWADPGQIYVSRISVDDFVLDLTVKEMRNCKFMADEYRVSWDTFTNHEGFDKDVVKRVAPTSKWDRSEEQANDISTGSITDDDEYEPMIDLLDVWLPEISSIATFPRHVQTPPLQVLPWEGPEGGPFDLLTFADVPDNVLPSSPMSNLFGLHELYNGLLRKQARQAKRQKTNPAYRPDAQDDAKRLRNASDGEWVKVKDPAGVNIIQQGGVAQENVAFSIGIMDLFDRQAGNLSAMAGLGVQSATVGQEELIHAAVSRKEAKMQQRVHRFTASVMGKIGHMMWVDEFLEVPGQTEALPGSGVYVESGWSPEKREGDFWQYNFDIIPGSTNYESDDAKIGKIERAMERLGQLYPIIQETGGTIDVQELTRLYATYLGIPELENVITFVEEPEERTGGASTGQQRMPNETTRNYVRHNVPTGGTQQARSQALQQSAMGAASPNQQQALSRPGV